MVELLSGIVYNYQQFFSWTALWGTIADPLNWAIIGGLIVLEGLLSADNALVLAMMVQHLPEKLQKKALFYGIFGAYFFRFVAIGLGTCLIKIWWIKIVGAAYLLWIALKFLFSRGWQKKSKASRVNFGFWRTILAVELMDIAFSMDSVLAALGVSDQVWVLYLGGIFGIMMMRGVAQIFVSLLKNFPELEATAYIVVALIGVKMMASAFGYSVRDVFFLAAMVAIFLGTLLFHQLHRYWPAGKSPASYFRRPPVK